MRATDHCQGACCMLDQAEIVAPDADHMRLADPCLGCRCGSLAAGQEPRPPNSGNVVLEYDEWLP